MNARRATIFGWIASLLIHFSLGFYVHWSTSAPELGFEFQLPTEVEFGLTDAVTVSQGAAPRAGAEPEAASGEPAEERAGEGLDAGAPSDGAVADAGVPDAGRRRRRDAGPPELAEATPTGEEERQGEGAADEGEGSGDRPGEGTGVAFLPAGSQIALRLDVTRVRESPLAADVRELLSALPDWQALLGGSGIDPLAQLDRLLVASPNLQRSRLIVAGRTSVDGAAIRAAAERMAAASGETLQWRTVEGVPVADWHDRDETDRVVAIIGPRHFVICRPQDLSAVLAVARARAEDAATPDETDPDQAEPGAQPPLHPADALLSMEEGEGLSLEVEGARNFARVRRRQRAQLDMVPTRVRVALSQLPGDRIGARSRWTYEDDEQAEAAASYWNRMREAYARNVITAVLGLSPILDRARIEADGDRFDGEVDMRVTEMRRLIELTRGMFEGRSRAEPAAPSPEREPSGGEPTGAGTSSPSAPSGAPAPPRGPRPPPSPY